MALVGLNGTRLAFGPNRAWLSTGSVRAAFEGCHGATLNRYAGDATVSGQTSKSGVPSGARHPVAWVPPRVAGGLSAFTGTSLGLSAADANLAEGRNLTGATTMTFTVADAALQLVVSATGTATITLSSSGVLAGALSASGTATISLEMSAAVLGAVADLVAEAGFSLSASGVLTAIGHMEADTAPTAVTPTTVAQAVWAALSSENNVASTMGRLLNSAGGAADPDAIAAAVWAYLSRTVDVTKVNGVTVDGSGTSGDPWGPA